ncbi:MAG: hypothetical protein KBG15_16655 [Kofleriaceae bacterium]|nr:hypothetical protein [Kofleriaceae bacterium]
MSARGPAAWSTPHRRLRAWAAYLAMLAWLLGLELLPNLHLWHHDAAGHKHAATGTIVTVRFGASVELTPHWHRDGEYHDPVTTRSRVQAHAPEQLHHHATLQAPHRNGSNHVATGLAHRATAIAAAPAMVPIPIRCVLQDVELALRTSTTLCALDALAPSARGPPTKTNLHS